MDALEDYENAPEANMDDDFGDALPMFNSNTYSSQIETTNEPAPEAFMTEEVPTSSLSKKSKRHKKDKKRSRLEASESPLPTDSIGKKKKHRSKSKEQAEEPGLSSIDANGDHDEPQGSQAVEEEAVQDPQSVEEDEFVAGLSMKKRKHSDSADGKRKRKRRSQDATASAANNGDADFLHRDDARGAALEAEAGAAEVSATPSRKPRAQALEPASDEMDVDAAEHAHDGANEANGDDAPQTDYIESLAREAWKDQQSQLPAEGTQDGAEDGAEDGADADAADKNDYPDPEDSTLAPNDEPDSTPAAPASSKRTRPARAKKAKPTFYEAPEPEEDAANELPSPSAATPAPRKRKQPATKTKTKKAKGTKLSQSMRGGSDEEEAADEEKGRRSRMTGFTQGRFTDEELERIKKAVERFRKDNDMEQHQVNEMIQAPGGTTAGDSNAQLWMQIFAECPDRHRQKVINITRKKFHNFVARGTWTLEQDAELSDLVREHGTKWSMIAGIINRHPEDVRDRFRNYVVCGDAQRKDAWSELEEQQLTTYVIEALGIAREARSQNPENSKEWAKPMEDLVDWQSISERMNRTRSRLQCITKWKSLNLRTHADDKLASNQPDSEITFRLEKARRQLKEMPEEERYRLLLAILGTGAGAENKISWQKLLDKQFRSKWHRSTQMLLWKRLKETIPDHENKTVKDCAQILVDHYNQSGELPDVLEGQYNMAEEKEYVEGATPIGTAPPAPKPTPRTVPRQPAKAGRNAMSSEFVTNSDGEEEEEEAAPQANGDTSVEAGIAEAVADANAASAAFQDLDEAPGVDDMKIDPALSAQMPVAKMSPTMRSPNRELASFKRQGARGSTLTDDPIEDDEEERAELPDLMESLEQDNVVQEDPPSDSVMDDMEDLPARVPEGAPAMS